MPRGPVVAIFRSTLLPASETFVVQQALNLTHIEPVFVGLESARGQRLDLPRQSRNLNLSPLLARVVRMTRRSPALEKMIAEIDPDLIHAHFGFDGVTVARVARKLKIPLIVTYHGNDVTGRVSGTGLRERLYKRRLREVLRMASCNIAVSDFIRRRLLSIEPTADAVVHHIGVPLPEPLTGKENRGGRIVFVGRLVEKKGVEHILQALSGLDETLRSTELVVVGAGPLRGRLEDLASRLGLNVTFMGHQERKAIYSLMRSSTVFCGPSHTASDGDAEGFGLVFAEAAANGLPVVAYRHGGVESAVEDGKTGFLVEENDVRGLADALALLLVDRELAQEMGSAGRERVEKLFNVVPQTELLEELYIAALTGREAS